MAEETKGFPEAPRLQEIKDWEKDHGWEEDHKHEHPDHARDVRTLLRIIEYLQGRCRTLSDFGNKVEQIHTLVPAAVEEARGMEKRITAAVSRCEGMLDSLEQVVAVINDDLVMFGSIAKRLLNGEPVVLDQLTPEERQWVELIPSRLKR